MNNTSKNVTAAVLTVNSTVARTSLGAVAFSVREPDQYLFHVYPYVRGLVMSNAIGCQRRSKIDPFPTVEN